jgi:hypothetical protein
MTRDADDKFSFYPIVRQGYRPDDDATGRTRVELDLKATGPEGSTTKQPGVDISLYGSGDVTGVDTDQVIRMEPEPETAEFPPNYFPLVEFDDPGLPWQFSPERADDNGRSRPWLSLVVVPEESSSFQPAGAGPLPVLETSAGELPDATESWAWAHAQIVGRDTPESTFGTRSNRTVSRLLCPRNLSPTTSYRVCVVPTFEPGRRAGLGLKPYPDGRSSVSVAWTDEDSVRLPVYHSWEFSTAQEGDFESLARELTPTRVGDDVGFRTVDVSNPGPPELKLPADPATDTGTVGLGGALKSASAAPDSYDEGMCSKLRGLLNDPASVAASTDYGTVGPPLYGRFHAGVPTLAAPALDDEDFYFPEWFDSLNTDPRHRIAAGIGTQVIQEEQDRLVEKAWEQFGDIESANDHLRRVRFAETLLSAQHDRLSAYPTGALLGVSSPIHGTMLEGETTLQGTAASTDMADSLHSATFRRLSRPTGPLARRSSVDVETSELLTRIETGRIPRVTDGLAPTMDVTTETDEGETTPDDTDYAPPAVEPMSGELSGPSTPGGEQSGSSAQPPSTVTSPDGQSSESVGTAAETVLTSVEGLRAHVDTARGAVNTLSRALDGGDTATVREQVETRPTVLDRCESIDRNTIDPLSRAMGKLVSADDAPVTRSDANERLNRLHSTQRRLVSAVESAIASLDEDSESRRVSQRLGEALSALETLDRTADSIESAVRGSEKSDATEVTAAVTAGEDIEPQPELVEPAAPSPQTVETPAMDTVRETVLSELDPIPRLHNRVADRLGIDGLLEREDPVEEVLAAPSYKDPAYRMLKEFDPEAFLPGIGDIPKNSISALQTNPVFIEAFMAGLNHELARELNWRNYPTDRRGTYFDTFWERKGPGGGNGADIEPIHTWDENDLGENSPRDDDAKVVLLIRGELLRRYPNTDIFAAKATADDGDRVPALPGTEITRDDAGDDIKFPEFRGQLEPDVTFFGFDLSPDEALYAPYEDEGGRDDDPNEGWFFVLQEPPAETRFGLDAEADDEDLAGTIPYGISADGRSVRKTNREKATEVEAGWSGLTWPQLVGSGEDVSKVTYVDVGGSQPGRENWSVKDGDTHVENPKSGEADHFFDEGEATEWGYNSAHMARATWQLPVRISIHADDMIHEHTTDGGNR